MSSLYIHIPFCKQACHYCDFHFSTNLKPKAELVQAIIKEIAIQQNYLPKKQLQSVYWGGGTPSLLSPTEFEQIWSRVLTCFSLAPGAEVTLEANPDDLSTQNLQFWKSQGVNRLSIGIQSFDEKVLQFLNRAHTAEQALNCVEKAQKIGFERLSVDLIYGIPDTDHARLHKDLEIALKLNVTHLSAYCLTIEEKTVFGHRLKIGTLHEVDEEFAAEQFEITAKTLQEYGFEQYEISNFAKNGHYAVHNSRYWNRQPYLGVGPGAHSYDLESRQYNVRSNAKYIKTLEKGEIPSEKELLTPVMQLNEYMTTRLRTSTGVDTEYIKDTFAVDLVSIRTRELKTLEDSGLLKKEKNFLILTEKGKLLADQIVENLMII